MRTVSALQDLCFSGKATVIGSAAWFALRGSGSRCRPLGAHSRIYRTQNALWPVPLGARESGWTGVGLGTAIDHRHWLLAGGRRIIDKP